MVLPFARVRDVSPEEPQPPWLLLVWKYDLK